MLQQGYVPGSCATLLPDDSAAAACKATLKRENGRWFRIIKSAHLSRPEDYLSIYQSGCNHSCKKCHSWPFSQRFSGEWMSTDDIAETCANYMETVTVWEPRDRATMFHATDLCRHCGLCATNGRLGSLCPERLDPDQILLSPQGWGPARNIVSFTGGDLGCCAHFYAEATEKIKERCEKTWVLFETNGYGLTPANLELLAAAGLDSFWLDIKAYEKETYRALCGASNRRILELPAELVDRGFVFEVLSLFIPGWVETDQIVKIAEMVRDADPSIPFTILAFFPEHKLRDTRPPSFWEMLRTYASVRHVGLENVKIGNCGVFVQTPGDQDILLSVVGEKALG
ncbi:MAG: radical SAM protein [Nitrososphaeria archaeon]